MCRMQAWILALRVLVRCAVSESRLATGVFEVGPSPAAAALANIPSLLVLHRSEQGSTDLSRVPGCRCGISHWQRGVFWQLCYSHGVVACVPKENDSAAWLCRASMQRRLSVRSSPRASPKSSSLARPLCTAAGAPAMSRLPACTRRTCASPLLPLGQDLKTHGAAPHALLLVLISCRPSRMCRATPASRRAPEKVFGLLDCHENLDAMLLPCYDILEGVRTFGLRLLFRWGRPGACLQPGTT